MATGSRRWALAGAATILVAAAVVVAILVSSGGGGGSQTSGQGTGTAGGTATGRTTGSARAGDPSAAYEAAARTALPSVVQIQRSNGLGSGVVMDGSGDIVTNAHVVAGEKRFVVISSDGKHFDATLRGSFPQGDVAVVRVSGGALRPARFGDSSKLQVGEAVLALGSPLGLRSSVTDGIVSAVSRTVSEGNGVALPSVVQTSAAINPGNSGGALVDLRGEVVGIPTLAALDPELGGTAPGVGFAISSNEVKSIATQLAQNGRVVRSDRAYLGVELRSLPAGGVLVVSVVKGGPAAKAGAKPGDVIVSVAGQPVGSVDDLATALASHRPGDRVPVKVRHQDGSTDTLQVTLGRLPPAG
jgi:putative serine protease PepD